MEKIAVYCSWADARILSDESLHAQLPAAILDIIRNADDARYLDTLAKATLIPSLTDQLFVLYEPISVDLAARWCHQTSAEDTHSSINVLACFARIIPAKPSLKVLLQNFIEKCRTGFIGHLADSTRLQLTALDGDLLLSFLLALFRLYSHDIATYGRLVSPVQLSSILRHGNPSIRFLTVRCLALYMRLADAMVERMISNHVVEKGTTVQVEGAPVPALLFSHCEERRWRNLQEALSNAERDRQVYTPTATRSIQMEMLSSQAAVLAGILVPRSKGVLSATSLVATPTTTKNFENLAKGILNSTGILLAGPSGSGKTLLVTEAAKLLNKLPCMITLYLNEQTDAKSLLGIYTTSPTDGSFIWQPGVLARAMLEGRWVLIEDIHRAPPEVIGVILPIIEHGEILVSGRNEKIRAATGFCILATTTESVLKKSKVNGQLQPILNPRLWNLVEVESLHFAELESLLSTLFPMLQARVFSFLSVHDQVQHLFEQRIFRKNRIRPPESRDLLKWCRRSQSRLKTAGLQSGSDPVDESVLDDIFSDAVACYAGHIPSHELHVVVATSIAEALHIPTKRMNHSIYESLPSLKEVGRKVCVGRASFPVINSQANGTTRSNNRRKSPFALTRGTLKILEEIASALQYGEPTLLVGETGIGKTTVIQHFAELVGQRLSVFNLSQQSESGDLLGGFKPITTRSLAIPMSETFDLLFDDTFSLRKNAHFQASIRKCISRGNWTRLVSHWQEAVDMADIALHSSTTPSDKVKENQPSKRRRLETSKYGGLRKRWRDFALRLSNLKAQVSRGDKKFAMAFVEGKIVQALRNGEWVLLDEINLATPETLESITGLLYNNNERAPSLLLPESGGVELVEGHRNFRLFAAMNPATDAGKRELPAGLRSRFTELFMQPSDTNVEDLTEIISTYLRTLLGTDEKAALDLARCYLDVRRMHDEKCLTDGAGQLPHFSIRSLVRALMYTNQNASVYGLRRALYEGFLMSFTTMLSASSEELVAQVVERHLLGGTKKARSLLNQNPKVGGNELSHVVFRHHLVNRGNLSPKRQPHYIITPFVERNLLNLARAVSVQRFPILLQGPTSSGKTSMVEYLAKVSGNEFLRINNHEHTDLQEYLGSYTSGEDGRLQYREGLLVQALRRGQWIVLDELNLAPTDVLEALNRLLDDNRELFIPETQETVMPHPNFVLFATQNPAGLYGGRKHLSRAFRNRFLELHFDDIPEDELEFILKERTQIAPSFCTMIVSVYKRLSLMRQSSRLFEQRNSFATLRDLFRWASRRADDREQLAVNGFMLLAERVRDQTERTAVKQIIEEVMKVHIDEPSLYSSRWTTAPSEAASDVIWTPAMRRLFVLVTAALGNNEPVLLVGETGCGKTQICQAVAMVTGQRLHTLNAHSNMETGDLIGAQRPVRNKAANEQKLRDALQTFLASPSNETTSLVTLEELIDKFERIELSSNENSLVQNIKALIARTRSLFEWADGSLVVSMKRGELFLLDEISLAEDSVLERLNSVLEPSRSILLAEKGPEHSFVRASPGFQFLATMNPGGDYGKRELSSALRNRLTEIWVPPLSEQMDVLPILQAKLSPVIPDIPHVMIKFTQWFRDTFHTLDTKYISLRELLTWVDFVRTSAHKEVHFSILHGAALVFIDSLGASPATLTSLQAPDIERAQQACLQKLGALLHQDVSSVYFETPAVKTDTNTIECGTFSILRGIRCTSRPELVFDAPTTKKNALRVLRALQLSRPILLEGDPGVGKTALVEAIAQAARKPLTRVNLSDQTDLMDLFGSDLPVEGAKAGNFSWRNGPFLQAMENGDWVLLDEMNLASQSVLEGLNSCLDHRKQVYIAELDRTFVRHQDFVLFATQNPHRHGGGRKGLPASFVSRFTVVYADALTEVDLMMISQSRHKEVRHSVLSHVILAVSHCRKLIQSNRSFDSVGGPWELNLRDIDRWLKLCARYKGEINPSQFYDLIISQRFRTARHRRAVREAYTAHGPEEPTVSMFSNLSASVYQVGDALLQRNKDHQPMESRGHGFPPHHLPSVRSLIHCVNEKWPILLVGASGSGKSTTIRKLAGLHGAQLLECSVTEDMDTMDFIGGYEQLHWGRSVSCLVKSLERACLPPLRRYLCQGKPVQSLDSLLEIYRLCNTRRPNLKTLQTAVVPVARYFPAECIQSLDQLIERQSEAQEARFGWCDGLLVEAVVQGYWLVLDNANTCSSAVLDRLNSLLEPGGWLVVSEQHESNGAVRRICPHRDFRIFLTMDPRRGELSRAMRNRCVEIYLDQGDAIWSEQKSLAYPTEAALSHWRRLQSISLSQYETPLRSAIAAISINHLSLRDLWRVSSQDYALLEGNAQTVRELTYYESLPESLFKGIHSFYAEMTRPFPLEEAVDDQPLHTELNEPLIQMTGNGGLRVKAARFGWLLESFLTLCRSRKLMSTAELRAASLPVADMTVLDRSIARQRVSGLAVDMTQPISELINALICAAHEVLMSSIINFNDLEYWPADEVNAVLTFLKDVVGVSQVARIQSGLLPVYIQIGQELFSKTSSAYPATAKMLERSLAMFQTQLKLRYGQSLSQLWSSWRPSCAASRTQLKALLKLESIMQAFDKLRQEANIVRPLLKVQVELLATRNAILQGSDDVDGLLEELQTITSSMKPRENHARDKRARYFAADFEALCQYQDLQQHDDRGLLYQSQEQSKLPYAALLSGRNTKDLMFKSESTQGQARLARIASFAGWNNPDPATASWKGTFALNLLGRLHSCRNEPLLKLASLTEEISCLLEITSQSTRHLTESQLSVLEQQLLGLIYEVVMCHQDLLKHELQPPTSTSTEISPAFAAAIAGLGGQDIFRDGVPHDHHFRHIWGTYLQPALCLATSRLQYNHQKRIGAGLVYFALASLQLWIPDRPTDPALALSVQRERYQRRKDELGTKLQALRIFESTFSGHTTNLRIRDVEQEMDLLGLEPPPSPVVRLEDVNLLQVQAEFSSVLNGILAKSPETILLSCVNGPFENKKINPTERSEETDVLKRNIGQMTQRLSQSPREYDDLTIPVVQLLQILDLGAAMLEWGEREGQQNGNRRLIMHITKHTPLLGATPTLLTGTIAHDLPDAGFLESEVLYLETVSLMAKLSPWSLAGRTAQLRILSSFESCYAEWKAHLHINQAKEAIKARFYEYRGQDISDHDVDSEEINDLFATFDNCVDPDKKAEHMQKPDSKAFTLQVAKLHASIYTPEQGALGLKQHLLERLKSVSFPLSASYDDATFIPPVTMLSGIFLLLEEQIGFFEGNERPKEYNIYADPNVYEVRRLLNLVQRIVDRTEAINERWPEHALPLDILACCNDVLSLPISDPISKLLTKVEKLHFVLNEWQVVASQEYSVAAFVDELTTLIIAWRRLELSSWSCLLAEESCRCEEDARLWWFMVYEVAISIPLRLLRDGDDCTSHAQDLVNTLISFLQATSLGQYSCRLRVLETFHMMAESLIQSGTPLNTVSSALSNVVDHFKRFEPAVQRTLIQGRDRLEQEVKEQIKLASWKDTNVSTLRESARRSHYKLFKVVKRHRALLAQSAETLFSAPDATRDQTKLSRITPSHLTAPKQTLLEALRVFEQAIDGWGDAPRRFREPQGAAASMLQLYESSQGDFSVGSELHEYALNFTSTVTELRSQTPSKIDNDNRALVLHLKARKRRLLAETLKDVRHMGVRRNLNSQELGRQRSLGLVLSAVVALNESVMPSGGRIGKCLSNARNDFHGFLDLVDQARKGREKHSEDLSSSEVGRCVGSLEGFLLIMQSQRNALCSSLRDLSLLEHIGQKMCNLQVHGASKCVSLCGSMKTKHDQVRCAVSWLASVLEVACNVLETQAKHAARSFGEVTRSLQSYQAQFEAGKLDIGNLLREELPSSLRNPQAFVTFECLQSLMAALRKDLNRWIASEPDAAYVLAQLVPWTDWSSFPVNEFVPEEQSSIHLDGLKERLFAAMDKIFIGMQRYCDAAKKIPGAVEDARWFTRSDQDLITSIRSFHMKEIATDIENVTNSISTFEEVESQKAISMCIVFTPIVQQFHAICEHAVERYADLHVATCHLAYTLVKSFNQIAAEGFCSPADRPVNAEEATDQLEQGTGLAEGEGAEDISKDVGDDEDLSELAQRQRDEEGKEEVDKEDNAVDMGNDDLHGEAKEDTDDDHASRSGNADDDFEEETGSVDNLDPSAVDEKLWEGLANNNEKEFENEDGAGKSTKDKIAAHNQNDNRTDGPEEMTEEHDEQGLEDSEENVRQPQAETTDTCVQQDQALELPEEMQLDGDQGAKENSISDDSLDEFSDAHAELDQEPPTEENVEGEQAGRDYQSVELGNTNEDTNTEGQAVEDEIMEDPPDSAKGEQSSEDQYRTRHGENGKVTEDLGGETSGSSEETFKNKNDDEAGSSGMGPEAELPSASQEQRGIPESDSQGRSHKELQTQSGQHVDPARRRETEGFKKLGDVLERWHRQRREILQPSEGNRTQQDDVNMADADLEHAENEQDQGDSQALGGATKDQAQALDELNAFEDSRSQLDEGALPPDTDEAKENLPQTELDQSQQETKDHALDERDQDCGAFIADGGRSVPTHNPVNGTYAVDELDDVDHQLSNVDLSTTELQALTSPKEALCLWSHYSSVTHPLSLILTEQLRLILSPTQATKLRGDFRTGKRLNIKRIIPYVASQYKRDKIWMRRSVPSKRNYQIMIAVDDSKSMMDGGAQALALETLALLCKSLSMLEVGEVCVVVFGDEEHIRIAHSFGSPFTNESGAKIYQNFGFQQSATNVKKMIQESIHLFREARARGPTSTADLWQLQLIISDGIYEDHELVRRLVRQASEERIMIVFVIVDSNGVRGNSILDLTQAVFEPEAQGGEEMKLTMKRYLDGFPFPYYVVVREVADLPGVLATALKGWFREVVKVG